MTTLPVPTEVFEKSTRVFLTTESAGTRYTHSCSLGEFFAANDFEPEEMAAIRQAMADGKVYRHGGGASPVFEIERV